MDCLFCKIIDGSVPSDLVYEDENVLAFRDINPTSPIHILFVPKVHFASLSESHGKEDALLDVFKAIRAYVAKEELDKAGYRLVINAGEHGQQTVDHLHVHLLAGRQFTWPAG